MVARAEEEGEESKGGILAERSRISFGGDENVLKLIVEIVTTL